ncbi:MAG: hypothetical protein M3305_15330 [Actinomycetota bacterium]|nr:hypothetical protein [Actinomycetota bacterium]
MKILVAFEDNFSVYREAIAEAILSLRPHMEVRPAREEDLEEELANFTPDLVICGRSNTEYSRGRAAWIELSTTTDQLVEICLGGQRRESQAPALVELLAIIDETAERLREDPSLNGC